MKRIIITLAALVAALTLTGSGVALAAAGPIPVVSDCNSDWYVNDDENGDGVPASDTVDLRPVQTPEGLRFGADGGLVHHAVDPVALADVPPGHLDAEVITGNRPLFKMETSAPYSTINFDSGFWSSKIPADQPGGQSHPVEHASELADLAPNPTPPWSRPSAPGSATTRATSPSSQPSPGTARRST